MKLTIHIQEILATSVESLDPWLCGEEETNRVRAYNENQYKFYKWLGHQTDDQLILDLGTRKGTSAVAFADNRRNMVMTYDNRRYDFKGQWDDRDNLRYEVLDVMALAPECYDNAAIIHLDLWHDGDTESRWLETLDRSAFSGILIMDDAFHRKFPKLNTVYLGIPRRKLILPTDIGHFTGTGIILYGDQEINIVL